ncbi:MAG: hypothetical protein ACI4KO_01520 [Ruminiclostridium sp.]
MYVEISVAVLVNSHKISENIGNNGKILLLNLYNRHISFFGVWESVLFSAPPRRTACARRAQAVSASHGKLKPLYFGEIQGFGGAADENPPFKPKA